MDGEKIDGGPPALVLGGSGLLGSALCAALEARGRAFEAPDRERLDLADPRRLVDLVLRGEFGVVFNAAAYADVNRAELPDERPLVDLLNRDLPRELARACDGRGVRLIHVSTDYVFDGRKGSPYEEHDRVRPLQVYGRSKLEGERAVLGVDPDALVARTSTLYGPGRRGRAHYVDAILRQAETKTRIEVVRPPRASPTYSPDLAEWLIELAALPVAGVVHTVNDGSCTRLELARAAVRLARLGDRVEVVERPEPPGTLARPADSSLDAARLSTLLGRRPRAWELALAEYVRDRSAA